MTTEPNEPMRDAKARRAKFFWPALVVGLLSVHLSIAATTVFFAVSAPGHSIEPDYYEKAVEWDESQRLRARSARMGWTIDLTVSDATDALERRNVSVDLTNADGEPIDGASVRATAFPVARGDQRQQIALGAQGDGRYAAVAPVRRAGVWEFRFNVRRGQDRFVHTARVEVGAGGSGA